MRGDSRSGMASQLDPFATDIRPRPSLSLEEQLAHLRRLVKRVHNSSLFVRYFCYIVPLALLLLIPWLFSLLSKNNPTIGRVKPAAITAWLEICWLSLWLTRLAVKALPWPAGLLSSFFTDNRKKWRDFVKVLEIPGTLLFWTTIVWQTFEPIMAANLSEGQSPPSWIINLDRTLMVTLVWSCANLLEKMVLQLITLKFQARRYGSRIETNNRQIRALVRFYDLSRQRLSVADSDIARSIHSSVSTTISSVRRINEASKRRTQDAIERLGDFAGRVASDFAGRSVGLESSHPQMAVLSHLNSVAGSTLLARRLHRAFAGSQASTISPEDFRPAFPSDDEATEMFTLLDHNMNGDISLQELEAGCIDIGRERKAITASFRDLSHVLQQLDNVLSLLISVAILVVLVVVLEPSVAGNFGVAGTTLLGLSWLFAVTAQEFLQSVISVIVKHPFDVGDRVSIYGNTGPTGKGDDYFVCKTSLLYTEFRKMEGQVVQAPNSYLNTLFILNHRRSESLAEPVPITIKYDTPLTKLERLREALLDFVKRESREYQPNLLTELREINDVHSITLLVIFFFRSSWQNEGLRLARRNKFLCALMVSMQEIGIEGPMMRNPGTKPTAPLYLQTVPTVDPELRGPGAYDHSTTVDTSTAEAAFSSGPSPLQSPKTDSFPPGSARSQGRKTAGLDDNRAAAPLADPDLALGSNNMVLRASMADIRDVPLEATLSKHSGGLGTLREESPRGSRGSSGSSTARPSRDSRPSISPGAASPRLHADTRFARRPSARASIALSKMSRWVWGGAAASPPSSSSPSSQGLPKMQRASIRDDDGPKHPGAVPAPTATGRGGSASVELGRVSQGLQASSGRATSLPQDTTRHLDDQGVMDAPRSRSLA